MPKVDLLPIILDILSRIIPSMCRASLMLRSSWIGKDES
nr:MAG TPA: hypothetical protein [Caudoviricetes sp.]